MTIQDKFTGCLLGGAVGDALGAPVEFLSRAEILNRYGPDGITEYSLAYGGDGRITDDTQMTLFTAEGLLRAEVRGRLRGIGNYGGVVARAYLRWLRTQGERPSSATQDEESTGWLYNQPELHHRRAPGNTCLAALRAMKRPGERARNESKGCGAVMRMAPVGLYAWHRMSPLEAFTLANQLAALTHGHPSGILSSGAFAVLVLSLVDGASVNEALIAAKACLQSEPQHEETLHAIEGAEQLASSGLPHTQAISRLGLGWTAEEALAISVYCALVARSFRDGVTLAVNHDGDSDSTGSIAGNLLGASLGIDAIPAEWLESLELRDVIAEVAKDLYSYRDWELGEYLEETDFSRALWNKYPGV